jgi:putative transcriptional regulator
MSRFRSTAIIALYLLMITVYAPVHAAQDNPGKGESDDKTLFLVARSDLQDPIFKEAVVLMFPPSAVGREGLVIGLIVNRPARVSLSEIFPDDNEFKDRSETAYFGGPVEPRTPGVIFRSSKAVKQATQLFGDIYVSFDPDLIKDLLKKPGETQDILLFLGRSQWASAQLQNEMAAGAWDSVQAERNLIFNGSPQSLWRKLFEMAEPLNTAKASSMPFDVPKSLIDYLSFFSRASIWLRQAKSS